MGLKLIKKRYEGSVDERRPNEGYGVVKGVPSPSGAGCRKGPCPSQENFGSVVPLKMVHSGEFFALI